MYFPRDESMMRKWPISYFLLVLRWWNQNGRQPSSTSRHVFVRTKRQLAHRDLLMPQISIIGLCVIIKRIIEPDPNPAISSFALKANEEGDLHSVWEFACGLLCSKYWRRCWDEESRPSTIVWKLISRIGIKWKQETRFGWREGYYSTHSPPWFLASNTNVKKCSIWNTGMKRDSHWTHIGGVLPAFWRRGAGWRGWSAGGGRGGSRLTWDLNLRMGDTGYQINHPILSRLIFQKLKSMGE